MKTENLIRALHKAGLKPKISECRNGAHTYYIVYSKKYKCSWICNDGQVYCCHIMGFDDEDDIRNDHMPGFFCRKIKDVVQWLTKE